MSSCLTFREQTAKSYFLFFIFLRPNDVDVPSSFSVTIIGIFLYCSNTNGIFCRRVSSVLVIQSGKLFGFLCGTSILIAIRLNNLNRINHLNTLLLQSFLCLCLNAKMLFSGLCFGISSSISVIFNVAVTSSPITHSFFGRIDKGNTIPCDNTPFIFIVFIL